MEDFNELETYDSECFPNLKTQLALDGWTLEDLLKNSFRAVYFYKAEEKGWYESISYAGMIIAVVVHNQLPQFAWEDVEKWTFHHAKKVSPEDIMEPYFEVWVN